MIRTEHLSDSVTLHLGDCRTILPTIQRADAVVTDPPYGIAYSTDALKSAGAQQFEQIEGDEIEPELGHLLKLDCRKIVFGANNFPHQLPHRGRWICWDKRGGMAAADRMLGSPFELAWEDRTSGYDRMVRILHGGVVNADGPDEPAAKLHGCNASRTAAHVRVQNGEAFVGQLTNAPFHQNDGLLRRVFPGVRRRTEAPLLGE